ncbi:putative membrane protein [Clostridium bornimense]|uniref:Putative membrane protein n=1 Tax=Clostridium bornimense TaxID=1216932 RepID=W6RXN9_9CLOT|nr:O-antigen ligase family protein [Clostridium bornimense]CDM69223.1 putative membrane protein [Clostridium bornimense]
MKRKVNLLAGIYIFLVYLALATERQGIYNVQYMSKYYIGIIICLILSVCLLIKRSNIIVINKKQLYVAKIMFLPTLFAFIYTLFVNALKPVPYNGFLMRSFGLVAYCLLAVIQAYIIYSYFKENALKYTFIAVTLSYLTSIIVAFREGGISQFVNMITNSSYNGSVLEMHEVAPIVSIFVFYYIYLVYFKKINRRKGILNLIICLVIILLSMKRIVILTCAIVIFLFFILCKKNKNLLKWMALFSILIITVGYIYIYIIKSGYFYAFLERYNINAMARSELWQGISEQYDFSIFYSGRGLGFVSIWMDNNWQYLNINGLTQSTGLHNDLLKFYIDLGFFGNLLFLFNLLYMNAKRISKKISINASLLYFTLISLQILTWFTDVVSLYHNFQWIFYLIVFSLLSQLKEK